MIDLRELPVFMPCALPLAASTGWYAMATPRTTGGSKAQELLVQGLLGRQRDFHGACDRLFGYVQPAMRGRGHDVVESLRLGYLHVPPRLYRTMHARLHHSPDGMRSGEVRKVGVEDRVEGKEPSLSWDLMGHHSAGRRMRQM
mmetsp:Transcript_35563/g.111259  ORF Transcript_35563/g.111259 Transcript_35563/m.111259 type:complete len:143 (+) Transcript_35563:72-500(+)